MPEEEAKRLLGAGRWEKRTSRTLTTWAELVYELDQVRITGVASDLEERADGVAALAVPVATPCGKLHAVAVPAPTQRLQQKRAGIERALRRTKRQIDDLIRRHQM